MPMELTVNVTLMAYLRSAWRKGDYYQRVSCNEAPPLLNYSFAMVTQFAIS